MPSRLPCTDSAASARVSLATSEVAGSDDDRDATTSPTPATATPAATAPAATMNHVLRGDRRPSSVVGELAVGCGSSTTRTVSAVWIAVFVMVSPRVADLSGPTAAVTGRWLGTEAAASCCESPGTSAVVLPMPLQADGKHGTWGFLPSRGAPRSSYGRSMEIWVLGTLEVSHDGHAVAVRGPQPRRLLALLAMTPGREVSTDRIVAGLWGEDPPGAAAATLQSHVARLRRDLPLAGVVRTGRQGYVLDVDADAVDSCVLERDVARGSAALLEGRLDDATRLLADALALWRGTPYAEFSGVRAARGRGRAARRAAARRPRAADLR